MTFSHGQAERAAIGVPIRKKWDEGWYNGNVIDRDEEGTLVRYSDDHEEWMSDDEVQVAVGAHQLSKAAKRGRTPRTGTKVRKRYDRGWFSGDIVSRPENEPARVLYEDGEEGFMSDEEARVSASAYNLYHDA